MAYKVYIRIKIMLQEFTLIHRRKPHVFVGLEAPVWSTCLRSLAFIKGTPRFDILKTDEVYNDAEAYRFLLEVVCGLHSPIVGETEVFGQFKTFAQEWQTRQPQRATLIQKILNDAKSLRSTYLSHLGTQSYGSWLRKNLKCRKIHMVGAGHLGREVLPYLNKHGEVTVHVRAPEKAGDLGCAVEALAERKFDGGALVIAAPVTAAQLRAWLGDKRPEQVFDLRETSSKDPLATDAVPLEDIFGQIAATKAKLLPIVKKIKAEIHERAEKIATQEKVRPQGWDDLCA
jgi:glutamyl-tRNA reductase